VDRDSVIQQQKVEVETKKLLKNKEFVCIGMNDKDNSTKSIVLRVDLSCTRAPIEGAWQTSDNLEQSVDSSSER